MESWSWSRRTTDGAYRGQVSPWRRSMRRVKRRPREESQRAVIEAKHRLWRARLPEARASAIRQPHREPSCASWACTSTFWASHEISTIITQEPAGREHRKGGGVTRVAIRVFKRCPALPPPTIFGPDSRLGCKSTTSALHLYCGASPAPSVRADIRARRRWYAYLSICIESCCSQAQ